MNNFEYLASQGVDALLAILDGKCSACAYEPMRTENGMHMCLTDDGMNCPDGFRKWLQAEHVEPDTWERLLGAIDGAIFAYENLAIDAWCEYGHGSNDGRCATCSFSGSCSCVGDMLRDIARRIRALKVVGE